jgi:uncharacterized protein DUF5666
MKSNKTIFGSVAVVIVVAAASFYGGMQTQKSLANTSGTQASAASGGYGGASGSGGGGGGFRRGGGGGVFGTVQSISGTTMVVSTQSGNKTVSLASSPQVSDSSGNQASTSSIQTGDTVIVRGTTGSDGTVTAQVVRINPSFGGQGAPSGSGSSSGATSSGT